MGGATSLFWSLGLAFLLASWMDSVHGFALGALIGYLLAQRMRFAERLQALEKRLALLEGGPRGETAAAEAPRTAPPAAPSPPPSARPEQPSPSQAPPASAAVAPASPAPLATPSRDLPAAAPSIVEQAFAKALAWLKRGNPLARAGIVILFFGGAFLAKYAADHSLLPLELRLAAIAAGAVALLVVGWRLRGSRSVYAQILQGGGVAGLYLTVFAAARLYHLVPVGFALPLLIAVALAAAVLAVAQGALALAVIGFGGGFLAPVLLSTGGGNHVALFTYYAVLNLGVFAVAWFRAWRVLNLVGFVFTFSVTGAWRALSYQRDQLASADFFLLLFFAMYLAIAVLFSLRQKPDLRHYTSASLVFGLPVVVFTLQATLVSHIEYGLAFSALAFGATYLVLAWTLYRTRHPNLALLSEAFAALGIVFASLAIPLAFDRQTTAAMWAVEGAGMAWIGFRQDRRLARAFGVLLQLAGGIGYLGDVARLQATVPLLNTAYVGTLLLAVSAMLTAHWFFRHASRQAAYETPFEGGLAIWATLWWIGGGLAELDRSAPASVHYGLALAFGGATLLIGERLSALGRWPLPRRIAAAVLGLAGVVAITAAFDLRHPFAEAGYIGWPLLGAAGYWLLFRLDADPDTSLEPVQPWLHGGLYWLLALVGAWEIRWQVAEQVPGVWSALAAGLVPALLLWVANRPVPRPAWPLARHRATYQRHASLPLALAGAGWVFVTNLTSAGEPAWLPYLPLLNPLDVASALVLITLAYYVIALPPAMRAHLEPRVLWGAAAGLVFVWLNAALIRALHHAFDTPLTFHGIRHSFLVQASLSIFWSVLGLAAMTLAARRAWRVVWMAGAGLMGVVIIKLFLIDLEGSGTLARIASFLSVGALLLLAGYLSPLPPRDQEKSA